MRSVFSIDAKSESSYNRIAVNSFLKGIIFLFWQMIIVWTVFLVLGMQVLWSVSCSKSFRFNNIEYLIIGLLFITIAFYIEKRHGEEIEQFLSKGWKILLFSFSAILLAWQLYACYGGYFLSGWDAKMIHDTVWYVYNGDYDHINNEYFSWYPNNQLLVWLFTVIVKTTLSLGIQNWEYALTVFQIVLGVLSCVLVYFISFSIRNSYRMAWAAYLVAVLFVGLSPWYIVAYSDVTGMIIPLVVIRLYQMAEKTESKGLRLFFCLSIGFFAMAGFYIKPQLFIVIIAFLIIEFMTLLQVPDVKNVKRTIVKVSSVFVGIILFCCLYSNCIIPSLHMQIDPEQATGYQHYLMMGLNRSTDGVYSAEDVEFTHSFNTRKERNTADMEVAKQRLKEIGIKGTPVHLSRKQLVNYGDGTFGWGVEGHSFNGDPKWAQNSSSSFIRSFIKPEGKYYDIFLSYNQSIWVTLIFLLCFAVFYKMTIWNNNSEKIILLMVLAIIGLTLFELLFEARARYLFCYSPIFIMLGVLGASNLFCLIEKYSVKLFNKKRNA